MDVTQVNHFHLRLTVSPAEGAYSEENEENDEPNDELGSPANSTEEVVGVGVSNELSKDNDGDDDKEDDDWGVREFFIDDIQEEDAFPCSTAA